MSEGPTEGLSSETRPSGSPLPLHPPPSTPHPPKYFLFHSETTLWSAGVPWSGSLPLASHISGSSPWHVSTPAFSIELIGLTLSVNGVGFRCTSYVTSSAHRMACSPSKVKSLLSPFIPLHPLPPAPPPGPLVITTLLPLSMSSVLFLLNSFTYFTQPRNPPPSDSLWSVSVIHFSISNLENETLTQEHCPCA